MTAPADGSDNESPANLAENGARNVRDLAERLALDAAGDDAFTSRFPIDRGHVFGGLIVGQALRAAQLTVDGDRPPHSLHASFMAAARGGSPLHLRVERTRDGGSFSTRRVVVEQEAGAMVLVLIADFHGDEPGVEYAGPATPGVPGPEGLAPGRYDNPLVESRDVPPGGVAGAPPHARHAWYRPVAPVPDDPLLHLQCLAYLSDHGPTRAAREPHAHLGDDARRQSVSLDHSVWFHRPVDVNGWLLSELVPVATGRGRGLAVGSLRTQSGDLVATVAQEVLLRERA